MGTGRDGGDAIADGEPRKLRGEAAWKAHLDDVEKRNSAAKRKAAEHPSPVNLAAIARSRELKRD